MNGLSGLAPVVLFAYARPEHTRRTVEALAANDLAARTQLIVHADAARSEADVPAVSAVRAYLATITGFASVTVHERPRNYGLADSIVDGVTATVSEHGRAIVLEDDLVTSPCFLAYMNEALNRYAETPRVMHIAGHMLDIAPDDLPESFFLRQSSCWGWATWDRSWRHFSRNADIFINEFSKINIDRFNLDGAYDYWSQLLANREGRLKTWAVYWYASVFNQGGLCLHPRSSLVANIGHDGSGTNCGANDVFCQDVCTLPVSEFSGEVVEHAEAMRRYQAAVRGASGHGPNRGLRGLLGNFFSPLWGRRQ